VQYSVFSGGGGPFTVSSLTGQLLTTGRLDRETTPTYLLTLRAHLLTDSSSFTLAQVAHIRFHRNVILYLAQVFYSCFILICCIEKCFQCFDAGCLAAERAHIELVHNISLLLEQLFHPAVIPELKPVKQNH